MTGAAEKKSAHSDWRTWKSRSTASFPCCAHSITEMQAQKYVSKEHAHKGRKQPTYGWGGKQPVNPGQDRKSDLGKEKLTR